MPQRRFKFKLCRLARGERSLNSLPIIQLLFPSLSVSPSPSLVHSAPSICCLLFPEKLSRQGELSTSLFRSVLFAPVEVLKKKFHMFSLYGYMVYMDLLRYFSLFFACTYHWLEEFLFQMTCSFVCFRRLFLYEEGGLHLKSGAPHSPHQQPTVAAVWCFVCVCYRFSCSLWAWCERGAGERVIPQSACCFRCAFSFMWDLEIVW